MESTHPTMQRAREAIEQRGLDAIAAKSLVNCHAPGLDSVLFDDTPGERLRMFVTRPEHTLFTNVQFDQNMSVAIHSHHCDVRLQRIRGTVVNVQPEAFAVTRVQLTPYRYQSPITKTAGRFEPAGEPRVFRITTRVITDSVLRAADLHTIYVPREMVAAWFVLEGKEDPDYESVCFSSADLTAFDFSGLYQPMSPEHLRQIIDSAFGG